MVHAFSYNYNDSNIYFLWDVESGSLHIVDIATFLVFKKINCIKMTTDEIALYYELKNTMISEVASEIKKLENEGLLNSPPKITKYNKPIGIIKALCLHICHDCNLSCEYCFASEGTYNTPKDYMSKDVGKAAIDFLLKNSGNVKNLEVDFFGGEPLLSMPVVKYIVDYAKNAAKIKGKCFSFTLTTNCINLNEETRLYLNKEMENVVLSLDGRKETHNLMRHSKNNKETYDIVSENALAFRKIRGNKKYYVRGTFTSQNLDFSKDVFALNDIGFDQISLEPVVLPDENPLSIKNEHLNQIFNEYDILAQDYLARRKTDKWFNFFHYMIDLKTGPCIHKRLAGCGAGTEYLAVSPIGDIYPCHQFVGKNDFLLGNVFLDLLNCEIQNVFSKNTVTNKDNCKNCFAKYYCGGGCAANAFFSSGSIYGQYKIGCEMIKKRLENSLAIWAIENMFL